jgi:peptidoglycan hydrolase FlgJ
MLPVANLSDRLSVDVQGAQSLRAKAASGDPAALHAAAKQFEAMVVQMMLKTMRQTKFTTEGDAFGDSNSLKMYQELLDQQWTQKMVAAKGLGFAEAIVQRLGVEANGKVIQQRLLEEADVPVEPKSLRPEMSTPGKPLQAEPASGSSLSPTSVPVGKPFTPAMDHKGRFISEMLPHARQAEAVTGVPAPFILAHAALESGWGRREIRSEDGSVSHNLFGIKATGWTGQSTEITTTEYRQGVAMKVSQKFRAYSDYAEGFTDYAKLLQRRYGEAVAAGTDAPAFANGLAQAGYATDPNYADKLRRTIASVSKQMGQV